MGNHNTKNGFEYSTVASEAAGPDESPVYTCPNISGLDLASVTSSTLYSLFRRTVSRFPSRPFLGTRESLDNGTFGPYLWETYSQVYDKVTRLADSLVTLIDQSLSRLPTFGIYCKTRAEWVVVDLACMAQSISSVILFDTLGYESIAEVIKATKMTAMALSSANKSVIYHLKREGEIPLLKNLVQFEPVVLAERKEALKLGFSLYFYGDLVTKGNGLGEKHPPLPDSVYSICYTSGTYGTPSGVVVKHKQMTCMIASVVHMYAFHSEDVYFSYLPQAHIMERSLTYILMSVGAGLGFYAGSMNHLRIDMCQLRATVFAAVPRIIYKFCENIRAELSLLSPFKQSLFKHGLRAKQKANRTSGKLKSRMWDTLVFKSIRNSVGGRVRLMIVGGAPISTEELEFMRLVMSAPIVVGYGLTESCASSFLTNPLDSEVGHVGGPLPFLEAKLINLTDSNGTVGELCLRGPQVSTETYFPPASEEEETVASGLVDSDGWLHTGDVVMRMAHNGGFKIVDRLKSLFKLSHGEYVAPEKIEVCYKCPLIDCIVVYGNPLKSYLVAIVVPNEDRLRAKFLKLHSVRPGVPIEALCSSPISRQILLSKISSRSALYHLNVYEQVKSIHLVPALPASVYSSVGKLKRYEAVKAFERELEALYNEEVRAL